MDELYLYARAGCHLCDETRTALVQLLAEREAAGLPSPTLVERDIDTNEDWQRAFMATIPVDRARATGGSSSPPARPASDGSSPTSSTCPPPRAASSMGGTDLTILVALAAGLVSFLSPCVLPLVPAYIGQLTAVAVASNASGRTADALDGAPPRPRLCAGLRGRLHAPRASPPRLPPAASPSTWTSSAGSAA